MRICNNNSTFPFFLITLSLFLFELLFPARAVCAADFARDLHGKLIVGYQGWFGYPGDYGGNKLWDHWSFKTPDKDNLIVDMLPDTDEYEKSDLAETQMIRPDGKKVSLYSCLNPGVVKKHFEWMQKYGIDGAAYQRFVAEVAYPAGLARRDRVLANVRAAAEATGRVFFVTYDVSGSDEKSICENLESDWRHLVNDLGICRSPNYLRHHGKPILQIWGFGFNDRPGDPESVSKLLLRLKTGAQGLQAVTLIGGVPTCWRALMGDSKNDPRWAKIYRSYDVVSPWAVNRFKDELGACLFVQVMVKPDMEEAKRSGVEYMPVVFPGFSWFNLWHCNNNPEKAIFNKVPRGNGDFYWKQFHELLAAHANMIYAAMFDEMNEGTALFKVETRPERIPSGAHIIYPGLDRCQFAPDHFLRITGLANKYLRTSTVPPEKLELH